MDILKEQNIPYRLPPFYYPQQNVKKRAETKHIHRLFIFLGSKESEIEKVAAEAARCVRLELLELKFEKGITDSDRQRYIAIFNEAMPADKNIEIASEANIPSTEIRQRYQDLQKTAIQQEQQERASIKREALLN